MMKEQKIITVRSARVIPALLAMASIAAGVTQSFWWFLSIPFIAVGWVCAAPNLNLANGMLAYVSMIGGFILLRFHEPSGLAIVAGATGGFYLSAIEMRLTAKPYNPEKDKAAEQSHPEATSKTARSAASEASDA